jgi:acetyl-CoA C-acetyltransferase
MTEPIYIIDGARTPFLKSRNRPGPFSASDLATAAGRALLLRQRFAPTDLDEVILGCASPSPDEVNIGRVVALRMGCGHKVPGWTVMRNCASGMQALDSAVNNIRAGRSNLVLAGGTDALSRAPLLFSDAMVLWLSNWYAAKTLGQRAALAVKFRPCLSCTRNSSDEGPDRSYGRPADGTDRREPRVSIRHHPSRDGRICGGKSPSCTRCAGGWPFR